MNEHSREALDAYYVEAASWNRDRVQASRSSQRIAWWVAIAACAIALLQAVALVLLTPLKTVVPYTLMVDRTTGYVQALKPLDQQKIAPDAALTQSFLAQYVLAREGFDRSTVNANYRKAALFSSGTARSSYVSQMQVNNPASPLLLYPPGTVIDAKVKSISPLGRNASLVRFETLRTDRGGPPQVAGEWVAIIHYQYSSAAMSLEDRFVNPLGFQVTDYRKNPEAFTPEPPAGSSNGAAQEISRGPAYYSAPGQQQAAR